MGGTSEVLEEEPKLDSSLILHPSSLAVCLVSGGMDSCVTAAIAQEENDQLAFLHVSYGQRTETRERRAFCELGDHFGVRQRLTASIDYLTKIGGSSITDTKIAVSEANLSSREIPTSYVPFRNSHLISIAASCAEVNGAHDISLGYIT